MFSKSKMESIVGQSPLWRKRGLFHDTYDRLIGIACCMVRRRIFKRHSVQSGSLNMSQRYPLVFGLEIEINAGG